MSIVYPNMYQKMCRCGSQFVFCPLSGIFFEYTFWIYVLRSEKSKILWMVIKFGVKIKIFWRFRMIVILWNWWWGQWIIFLKWYQAQFETELYYYKIYYFILHAVLRHVIFPSYHICSNISWYIYNNLSLCVCICSKQHCDMRHAV